MRLISAPLAFVLWLAAAPAGVAADDAPATAAARPERRLFDLDLSALYRSAAAQGAPKVMLPEPQRDGFAAAATPFAFTTPSWSQHGAFGHILELPPPPR